MADFSLKTPVVFGSEDIVLSMKNVNIRSVVIVSGGHSQKEGGIVHQIKADLEAKDISVQIAPPVLAEPSSGHVDDLADTYVRHSNVDTVIAIGGGSVMDTAKAIALLADYSGKIIDFEFNPELIPNRALNIIAIPTTSGSGSEVTPYTVITNDETKRKFTLAHDNISPALAIVQPSLTVSLPNDQTLATALDAWVHLFEAATGTHATEIARNMAKQGMNLIYRSLPKALENKASLKDRENLAYASLLAGQAISNWRTGMIHTVSVAVSQICELPHGLLNAIITPYVLRFNVDAYGGSVKELAHAMSGRGYESDKAAVAFIAEWLGGLNIPEVVTEYSMDKFSFEDLVARVQQDKGLPNVNPKPFLASDLNRIIHSVLGTDFNG
ncbi:iron-containing alcohol dehydrogenase [Kordiimonas sp. SCSIO 12603]|uniref:iron-containing alcohol dehydrogenase family protein n=1 Tax=Kordiimonas sp. SCSIO 12603 TaxID=2829596 RepID=UPI0021085D96|nr:iron-containing alcohol dehydrogenase [Kordiimonas sp. SCSIO 12603]UTW57625.1 iron-containing alcohol dehydrogenase [Kordiimonas sp. SCSIO 12603]